MRRIEILLIGLIQINILLLYKIYNDNNIINYSAAKTKHFTNQKYEYAIGSYIIMLTP